MSATIETKIAELWQTYYPGKTPEQAYSEARVDHDRWFELYQAQQAVVATYHDCETEEDRADYWKRLFSSRADLLRHDGVPAEWIAKDGTDTTPAGICRECWKPGAIDIDGCGGCNNHYHPACHLAMSIRCDLRIVAYRQLTGDEKGAAEWERVVLAKHANGGAS